MIGACVSANQAEKAMLIFTDIVAGNPDIGINQTLLLRLAKLLIVNDRSEDAFTVLKQLKPVAEGNANKNAAVLVERKAAELVSAGFYKKKPDLALQLLAYLEDSEAIKISPYILSQIVKGYAVGSVHFN